jgi:hypothetical protein
VTALQQGFLVQQAWHGHWHMELHITHSQCVLGYNWMHWISMGLEL